VTLQSSDRQRPIGYWLKEADRAITDHVDRVQAANGVSRLDWQVLNSIHEVGHATPEHLASTLHMFLDRPRLDTILANLAARGWTTTLPTGEVVLLDDGERHHATILAQQQQVRRRAMDGITSEEYETTVRVLHRLITNLESGGSGAEAS
jgi:DNA-binding MarR family transcriptional regulator